MVDKNKSDSKKMWKTLKEIIRGETTGPKEVHSVDFEILDNTQECNLANKFNLYYKEHW